MSIKRFFNRGHRAAELDREIEAHIELEANENRMRGLSPHEARRQAQIKFGSQRRVRESEWEHNTMKLIDDTWRDKVTAAGVKLVVAEPLDAQPVTKS